VNLGENLSRVKAKEPLLVGAHLVDADMIEAGVCELVELG
jgi:hypothetical protein